MKVQREDIQTVSDIDLFNRIGEYAKSNGFEVVYFKTLMLKLDNNNEEYMHRINLYDPEFKYMHYIHLYKDSNLRYSIYYDEYNLSQNITNDLKNKAFYEFYDLNSVQRFTKDLELKLLDKIKEAI